MTLDGIAYQSDDGDLIHDSKPVRVKMRWLVDPGESHDADVKMEVGSEQVDSGKEEELEVAV